MAKQAEELIETGTVQIHRNLIKQIKAASVEHDTTIRALLERGAELVLMELNNQKRA